MKALFLLAYLVASVVDGQDISSLKCMGGGIGILEPIDMALTPSNLEGEVDQSLDSTSLSNFVDLCLGDGKESLSFADVIRRTSEICEEYEIDTGEEKCAAQPSIRYGFDSGVGECVSFNFTGCGGNENNFVSLGRCQIFCEDPCQQTVDSGVREQTFTGSKGRLEQVKCETMAGEYYYYDQERRGCSSFRYLGCGGNKNRFETLNECSEVCANRRVVSIGKQVRQKRQAPPLLTTNSSPDNSSRGGIVDIMQVRGELCDEMDDTNVTHFCERFPEAFPDAYAMLQALHLSTSQAADSELSSELNSLVKCTDGKCDHRVVTKKNLFTMMSGLKWAVIKTYNNPACKHIEITVRIRCVKSPSSAPTDQQFTKLCDLAKQGIKKHLERDLYNPDGSLDYPVTVNVVESNWFAKTVILQWYTTAPTSSALSHPFNLGFPWLPVYLRYQGWIGEGAKQDLHFMRNAAHTFIHDVVTTDNGLIYSLTHQLTSDFWGNPISTSPQWPQAPSPIDLFKVYNGGDFTDYFDRVIATEDHIESIASQATFKFSFNFCPTAAKKAPCLVGCKPEWYCSWFRCHECRADSHCGSDEYCAYRFNIFRDNECLPKLYNGEWCLRDGVCLSGMCDGGRCVECKEDHHCGPNHFCKYKDLPGAVNMCEVKRPIGAFCWKDNYCVSEMCDGGQCVECEIDSHCPSGQWCRWKNFPGILNRCVDLLPNGGWCGKDHHCLSGMCDGGRCTECEEHSDCPDPTRQYCRWNNTPLVQNYCHNKKCRGWCSRGAACLSGVCRPWGRCKKC